MRGGQEVGERALVFQNWEDDFKRRIQIHYCEETLGHCCNLNCAFSIIRSIKENPACGPQVCYKGTEETLDKRPLP